MQSTTLEISDENLIESYAQGNVNALDELISRYKKPLYSFLWRFSRSSADVDELFQETWLRVIRKASTFERHSFKGWIFKIAHNLAIDRNRVKRDHLSLDQTSVHQEGETVSLEDTLPSTATAPDALAARGDIQKAIAGALASLPEEQREVFILRMDADMPFKEIARIQGTSTNTALARMQYALMKMRKLLEKDYQAARRHT